MPSVSDSAHTVRFEAAAAQDVVMRCISALKR